MLKTPLSGEITDLAQVMYFLLYLRSEKPTETWGGYTVNQAWEAFCRLHFNDADPEDIARRLWEHL